MSEEKKKTTKYYYYYILWWVFVDIKRLVGAVAMHGSWFEHIYNKIKTNIKKKT